MNFSIFAYIILFLTKLIIKYKKHTLERAGEAGEEKPINNCTLETLERRDRHKIILDQLRTIDKQPLIKKLGILSKEEIKKSLIFTTGQFLIKVLDEDRFSQRKLFPIEMKGVTW